MPYRITLSRLIRGGYPRRFIMTAALAVGFLMPAVSQALGSEPAVELQGSQVQDIHFQDSQFQDSQFQGKWQQGAVIRGLAEPGSTVEFLGRSVRLTPEGHFILGLGRDAAPQAVVTITSPNGQTQEYTFEVKQRDYNIQRIDGIKSKHVTPPASVTKRIREEAAQVYLARQTKGDNLDFMQPFVWPLTGPVTGVYGSQRFYNGVPRSPHYGIDIAAPKGTSVTAPAAGMVTLAHDNMYYSGGTLIIDHGYGLSSTFLHLSKILVEPGERVEQGQVIAEVGASGRVTGPHLDWRMNWFNQRVDPQLIMAAQGQPKPAVEP